MPQQLEVIQKMTSHKGKVWSASWHPSGNEDTKIQVMKKIKTIFLLFQEKYLQVAAKINP